MTILMHKWPLTKTVTKYVQWKHVYYVGSPKKRSRIVKLEFNLNRSILEVRKVKL